MREIQRRKKREREKKNKYIFINKKISSVLENSKRILNFN